MPAIKGSGSAASIEGADAPYGRKARQPLKGCALTKIGFANTSIPSLRFQHKTNLPRERFVYTSGVRPGKPQFPRFGTILLDTGQAQGAPARHEACRPWKGLRPLRRLASPILLSPLSASNTKRTSHMRGSYTLPEFVPKNPSFPDLAQCFWMKSEYSGKAADGSVH